LREVALSFLKSCVDCGFDNPIALEFDHRDHLGKKRQGISQMVAEANVSVETLPIEIAKCEVRCANCHRLVTSERGSHWKTQHLRAA